MKTLLHPGRTLAFIAGLLVLVSVACTGSDDDPPPGGTPSSPTATPTSPSTVTPTAPATPEPTGQETGITVIDDYLAAREDGDLPSMTSLLRTHRGPCGSGDYALACPPGASEGTPVDAFPWWGCHGPWSNQGTTEQAARFILEREGELRSVVRFDPSQLVESLPADVTVAAIFEQQISGEPFAWAVIASESNGGIYGWVSGCPLDVPGLLEQHFPGATEIFSAP